LHDDVDPHDAELKKKIAAGRPDHPDDLAMSPHKVRLQVQERYLNDVSAIDEVRHIEEAPTSSSSTAPQGPIMNAHVVVNGTAFRGRW